MHLVDTRAMPRGPYKKRRSDRPDEPGNFIREWREFRKMTQQTLAELTDLSIPTISNIESGTVGYSRDSLRAIARALDCTAGDLIDRRPGRDEELSTRIQRLPAAEQQVVADLVETLFQRFRIVKFDEAEPAAPPAPVEKRPTRRR